MGGPISGAARADAIFCSVRCRVSHHRGVTPSVTENSARTVAPGAVTINVTDILSEIARSGPQTRALFTEGLKDTLVLPIDRLRAADNATLRSTAISIYSAMIGAIGAARAVDDPALSEEIMRSTAAQIKTLALPPDEPCSESTPRQVR
jgi:hypothetical protein